MSENLILFVDPEIQSNQPVVDHLREMGLNPVVCETVDSLSELQTPGNRLGVAVIGASKPNGRLSETVQALRLIDPEMVMICATDPSVPAEQALLGAGVDEIIFRPYSLNQLEGAVRMGMELRRLRDETHRLRELLEKRQTFHGLVGGSEPMMALYRYLDQIGHSLAPVLIQSEPGTEIQETVVALHRCSGRGDSMIRRFDASHLDPGDMTIFLRQLNTDRPGILWLDNVERLSSLGQEVLMNILSGEGSPAGWRIVASSDHNLDEAIEERQFRRDLFYRINTFPVRIPPLRERLEDLPLLAADRLRSYSRRGTPAKRLSHGALIAATSYNWPRNVAEFESALRAAAMRCPGAVIEAEHLPPNVAAFAQRGAFFAAECSLRDAKAQFEQEYYRELLIRTRGNMSLASKISKVGRPYLYKKIRECELNPEAFRVS